MGQTALPPQQPDDSLFVRLIKQDVTLLLDFIGRSWVDDETRRALVRLRTWVSRED